MPVQFAPAAVRVDMSRDVARRFICISRFTCAQIMVQRSHCGSFRQDCANPALARPALAREILRFAQDDAKGVTFSGAGVSVDSR
jgi:hypothetical protein